MAEKRLNCGINKTLIMATEITVPDIGDFENVEIIEILVKPGDVIKKNDPVVTLESDKSSVEVPSPFAGKISSLEVKIGDKVSKGNVLAVIESEETKASEEPIKQINEKTKDYSLWKIHYCADFTYIGHPDGLQCIPIFQLLVPNMTLEPGDVVTHYWTILREIN